MKQIMKRVIAGLLTVQMLTSLLIPGPFVKAERTDTLDPGMPIIEGEGDTRSSQPEEALLSTGAVSGITISFVIYDSNYTSDWGNAETHITADNPIVGGELAYTLWAGQYKVTGTGTVCTYTIPSGTSLAANGISFPQLHIVNIDNPSSTYNSLIAWHAGSQACTVNTVFTEDTELELMLFEQYQNYSIDFVCCEEHNSSIGYFVNGIETPNFTLGACIGGECIPTKEAILPVAQHYRENANWDWERAWAEHDYEHLVGWQLKVYSSGEFVPLTTSTPITNAYVNPMYGSSIKAYPIFDTPVVPAVAIFVVGDETVETRDLSVGAMLGTLPTASAPEGQVFVGWREAGEGTDLVSETTIISCDTTYVAVFQAEEFFIVTFHDMLPDGSEAAAPTTETVLVGTRLSEIADAALSDGVMRSACIWHIGSASAPIAEAAYTVTGNVDLYTYTFQLVLNYAPPTMMMSMARAVVATPSAGNGAMTITVTAREGEQLTAADLVIDGIDYGIYEWTYEDDQQVSHTLNIAGILSGGLSRNIMATSDGTGSSEDVIPAPGLPVNFYVFINGQRVKLASREVPAYQLWDPTAWNDQTHSSSGNWRHYLLAQTLEIVYGEFGFHASDLEPGTRFFPNTTPNDAKIWADTAVQVVNGLAYSPVVILFEEVDVYYLPKQSLTASSGNWSNFQTSNSFYTITVEDPDGLANSDLPDVLYALNGQTATVTVSNTPNTEGMNIAWSCVGANNASVSGTVNGDGTTTFTIPNISQPYTLSPVGTVEYTVTLHDILPNGTESGTPVTITVPSGGCLGDLADGALSDGTVRSACVWYDGIGTPVSFSDYLVNGNVELYTHTYQLTLELVDDEEPITKTIQGREGMPLPAASFVEDGVDFSTFPWIYEDIYNVTHTLDISNLIANGLTENIAAISNGPEGPRYPSLEPEENFVVNFYMFVDNERVLLERRTDVIAYMEPGKDRRYIPADVLEEVYGDYGFAATDMTVGTRYFPHVDEGRPTLWADTDVLYADGQTFSPILMNNKNAVDVFYLPRQTLGKTSGNWEDFRTTDSFYTVRVQDVDGIVYSTVPPTTFTKIGDTATITLSNTPVILDTDFSWSCVGLITGSFIAGTENPNDTVTFEITDIHEPYAIVATLEDGYKHITYGMNRPQPPLDAEYECPTMFGQDVYTELLEAGTESYVVLAPSQTSYFYLTYKPNGTQGKHIGKATFLGWALNGNLTNLIQPDTVLNLADYPGSISLVAQWDTNQATTQERTGPMVNFYVALTAQPLGDNLLWEDVPVEQAFYTDSVYTDDCGVDAGIVGTLGLYDSYQAMDDANQYYVLGGTEGTNIHDNHLAITGKLAAGYTLHSDVDDQDYTFRLTFPTDEQVLHRVRQLINQGSTSILVNGHEIPADDINTSNFTVWWYVFKYDTSDGWHIDGMLVRKPGMLRVTKTFSGDAAAIQEVKESFSIDVALALGQAEAGNIGKHLTIGNADSTDGGNAYAWNVPVDLYFDYVITENDYLPEDSSVRTTVSYSVVNSAINQNSGVWQDYLPAGVTVTGEDQRATETENLTVNLRNVYTSPNVLTIHKIDASTGHSMAGVSFTIADSDDQPILLTDRGDSHYSIQTAKALGSSTIETGSTGQIYLTLPAGTYHLTEHMTSGYFDPGVITIVIGENPDHTTVLTGASAQGGIEFVETNADSMTVTIKNHADPKVNLKVKKVWANGEDKPVAIRLYHKEEALRTLITLDGVLDENETTAWEYVFTNLPLYVDGEPAQYTVREERIDNFMYSDAYPDGYRHYQVDYSDLIYRNAQGQITENISEAASLELVVTNSRNTGALSIQKIDEYGNPLPGATFQLFQDVDEWPTALDTPLKVGTSDTNGTVDFGIVNQGQYYLVEYSAPDGFDLADELYRLKTESGIITMERWDEETQSWILSTDRRIINERTKTDVTITKTVSGGMGNQSKDFGFVITCSEPILPSEDYTLSADGKTASFSLSHGRSIALRGVPVGAMLTVTETEYEDYDVSVLVEGVAVFGPIAVCHNLAIVVNNHKDITPDTGILLDSWPYVLILAGVAVCVAFLTIRKRRNREEE